MTSRGLVYVDETFDEYENLRLPSNWRIHRSRKWGSIAASMRYCQKRYPDATQYGWLADDNIPKTPAWDKRLEEAAGDWYISCARDLWMSEKHWRHPTGGPIFTAALCWGAKLIEAVGWWALPGVRQGGIDGAWNDLSGFCGLTRYLDDVVVEHKNWQTKKREWDETDKSEKHGEAYIEADLARYYQWVRDERDAALGKIKEVLPPDIAAYAPYKPRRKRRRERY